MHCPTGIQEVTGSILGPATRLLYGFGHEIISTVILSLPLIQEGSCQLLAKVWALSTGYAQEAGPGTVWIG